MPGGKDFLQAYNCQAVVDSAHQGVAARATNQTSDKQQAAAMTIDNVGHPQSMRLYSAKASTSSCSGRGPGGRQPATAGFCSAPRSHTRPSAGSDATEVTDQAGSAALRFAMQTVEPVGQIKRAGDRQPARGLEKVNGEWADLRPQPAEAVPPWCRSVQRGGNRSVGQRLRRVRQHDAIGKAYEWLRPAPTVVAACSRYVSQSSDGQDAGIQRSKTESRLVFVQPSKSGTLLTSQT